MGKRTYRRSKSAVDFGAVLLFVGLLIIVAALCVLAVHRPMYTPEQMLEKISIGRMEDERTLGLTNVDSKYKCAFLEVPGEVNGTRVTYVEADELRHTDILHVLLPDSVTEFRVLNDYSIKNGDFNGITVYTSNARARTLAEEMGFMTATPEEYHSLYEETANSKPGFSAIKSLAKDGFKEMSGSIWIVLLVIVVLALMMWGCALLSVKSGRANPLDQNAFSQKVHILFTVVAMYLTFFLMLGHLADGIETDGMLAFLNNWPMKIALVLFGVLLLAELIHKRFAPWWFVARVFMRCLATLVMMAITAVVAGILLLLGEYVHHIFVQLPMAGYIVLALFALAYAAVAAVTAFGFGWVFDLSTGFLNALAANVEESSSDWTPPVEETYSLRDEDGNIHTVHKTSTGYTANGAELYDYNPSGQPDDVIMGSDGKRYQRIP